MHKEILFSCLSYVPRLDRIDDIEDITKSKQSDWEELKKAIKAEIGINITTKSILNLAKEEEVGLKNQTVNIISAFLLKKENQLIGKDLDFENNFRESKNYYLSKYITIQKKYALEQDKRKFKLRNKDLLFFIFIPIGLLVAKLILAGFFISNIIALYILIVLWFFFYKSIDEQMGFSISIIGTTFFIIINTFAYFYSYHLMPSYQIVIKKEFEDMYYWGLTFTNILLNSMSILNFMGYVKAWRIGHNKV